MSIQRLAGRDIGLEDDGDPRHGDETQHLLLALKELLDRLSNQNRGHSMGESEEVERWDGGGYLYFETVIASAANAEIDVNIQRGRAFIRMAQ